jgi:hypothetical protein
MTASTFEQYVAEQDARNTIQLNVTKWTLMLCDALKQNYIDYSIKSHKRSVESGDNAHYHIACITDLRNGECDYEFIVESGRKYHKIIMVIDNGPDRSPSRSVHAFVSRKTGELYKSASWRAPAKGVRYDLRIIEQREQVLANCDWAGGYLYAR